jgi:hypothetical protein
MITRSTLELAVTSVLTASGAKALEDLHGTSEAIGDRLGLPRSVAPAARARTWIFVRRQEWIDEDLAARFDGVIVGTRNSRGRYNRSVKWYEAVRSKGVEIVTCELMVPPGEWKRGLAAEIAFARSVGARAFCINAEPSKSESDWRGKHAELQLYTTTARDLCDQHGMELWVTSWAICSTARDFPWLELIAPAHVCIPQPYEVHGRSGDEYVAQVIAEWRERGASKIVLGRGAHENDKSDSDAWRTPREIAEHRQSTPAGYDTAWWTAQGEPPGAVVDAILAP